MISNRLRSLRENINKEQYYIAQILGIARNTYTQYETGNIMPTLENLCKLAKYYNVSLDYILGIKNTKKPYGEIKEYNRQKFAINIKLIRTKLNYTQAEIANLFSCNRVTVACYENGTYRIPIDYLIKLSTLSKIPTDFIVGIIQKTF